jgi:UDP-3-O-[3-hydroxymyristoyl] glucosamine N-acyltransferase
MEFSLSQIAELVNGKVDGDGDLKVSKFDKIEEGQAGSLTFLSNPKYEPYIYTTKATAVLVNNDFTPQDSLKPSLIRVEDPYLALTKLMQLQNGAAKAKIAHLHPSAAISAKTELAANVSIGAFTVVSDGVKIGENSLIDAQVFIGQNVTIGKNCLVYAGVKIFSDTVIGDHCTLHGGSVIGSDGFGFAPRPDGTYETIPQLGNVILGKNVSVGSNSTIDRATLGSTVLADGVKIDNLVQIAHNVEIGENTVIAAQTGISGSTKIGKNCVVAGQVGFAGHIKIADNTKIGGQSAVTRSIKTPNGSYAGRPLLPVKEYLKMLVNLKNLK